MEKDYCIEGRHFRTKADYEKGLKDQQKIQELRKRIADNDVKKAKVILNYIRSGKLQFQTILGQDFRMELEDLCDEIPGYEGILSIREKEAGQEKNALKKTSKETASKEKASGERTAQKDSSRNASFKREISQEPNSRDERVRRQIRSVDEEPADDESKKYSIDMDAAVKRELKKLEIRRKLIRFVCCGVALVCFGLFGIYEYYQSRTLESYDKYEQMKEEGAASLGTYTNTQTPVIVNKTGDTVIPEVLPEYKNLLNVNKKLIGWLKIDDIDNEKPFINYPVMQTSDNEYYLTHNLEQEYDKNGSIFMDKDCDVLKPSTNFILYGHRMQSGAMFGKLSKYEDEKFLKKHQYIEFDTIYEKGLYQVMYVFRSTILNSDDVSFKYYQFIDANSSMEFDSNMDEMKAISLVDTGVTAEYGDRLLTLSTCDYYETNGRFVVVAKKVTAKE